MVMQSQAEPVDLDRIEDVGSLGFVFFLG